MQIKFVAAAAANAVALGLGVGSLEAAPGMGASAPRGAEAASIERVTYAWYGGCSHFRSHRYGWHQHCHWRHRHCYWGQRCWGGYPSWGYRRRWGQDHDGQHRAWA
ncbi:MAG TPA: hypothetical protein VFR00_14900 [Hyphomicrobiaceae bacterium]|nr:hypothetical protein [Hyphomicrobiaceae bacterium]